MNRTATVLVVLVLLVAGMAAPAAGTVADSDGPADRAGQAETATPASNESAESDAPGAIFAGVVDVQEAEVESELEGRAFDIQVSRANSNGSKAAIVARQVDELTHRTEALRERKQSLSEARENGSISEARYRAEMAGLAARSAAVERQLDRTEAASRGMPDHVLESKGVNATAIETLRNESRSVGAPVAAGVAGDRGGGLVAGNASPGRPETVPGQPGPPTEPDGSATDDGIGPGNAPGANSSGPPADAGRPDDPSGRTETPAPSSSNANGATPTSAMPTSATTTPDGPNTSPASNGRGAPEEASDDTTTTSQPDDTGDGATGSNGRGPPSSLGGGL